MNQNGFRIEPYLPKHFFEIVRRSYELQTLFDLPDPNNVSRLFSMGPAFTGYAHDKIIAAGGIVVMWKGVGEAWALTSPLVRQYPIFFTRTIRNYLNGLIITHKFERVQSVVQKDYEMAIRWIEALGFKPEGEMPKYRAGKTFVRYARLTETGGKNG